MIASDFVLFDAVNLVPDRLELKETPLLIMKGVSFVKGFLFGHPRSILVGFPLADQAFFPFDALDGFHMRLFDQDFLFVLEV